MNYNEVSAHYFYRESLSCVKSCYSSTPPSAEYADRVARLMVGTMAYESLFYYRRQTVFNWDSTRGAWGLGQMELSGINRAWSRLTLSRALSDRASRWVFGQESNSLALLARIKDRLGDHDFARLLSGHDRLAIVLMRGYYLADPLPVPSDIRDQAEYYKRVWNTPAGKATPEKYIETYRKMVEPYLDPSIS